jgi:hypothetical protein
MGMAVASQGHWLEMQLERVCRMVHATIIMLHWHLILRGSLEDCVW